MGRVIDLVGQKFGRWSVKSVFHNAGPRYYWKCRCDCGTERAVWGADLKRGGSISCGCHMRERNAERLTTHGLARHPAYRSWIEMKARCENPDKDCFALYGGRGIKVCDRWSTFGNFWQDMGASWKLGLSIDRIQTSGNYEPGNCRWATRKQQANNRRTNITIQTPVGRMNVTEAAETFGLRPVTIFARIRYGWPEDQLLLPPLRRNQNG